MLQPDDKARIFNVLPAPRTESDWKFADAAAAGLVPETPLMKQLRRLHEQWLTEPDEVQRQEIARKLRELGQDIPQKVGGNNE